MKYRAWEKCKKGFYNSTHFISRLVTACHICTFSLETYFFYSATRVVNTWMKKKKKNANCSSRNFCPAQSYVSQPMKSTLNIDVWRSASCASYRNQLLVSPKRASNPWEFPEMVLWPRTWKWHAQMFPWLCCRKPIKQAAINEPVAPCVPHQFPVRWCRPPFPSEWRGIPEVLLLFKGARGLRKKCVCHLAGRESLYGCPISPTNKSPNH